VVPNALVVEAVTSMGFSEFAGQRAALATGNADPEAAVNWTLAHIEDVDLNDPLPPPAAAGAAGAWAGAVVEFSADVLDQLTSMGFTEEQARAALGSTGGDVARACDWLFSRDDLDMAVAEYLAGLAAPASSSTPASAAAASAAGAGAGAAGARSLLDGPGRYSLVAIISHIGKSTASGHYVAHIKKDGAWVLFNDDKVAASKQPPLDAGYMYLFKRHE
jgi:ubiquitin carboxyl-terminal hydrolase 5/13